MYSTAEEDSCLLDHDLNSFRFYDEDGRDVPEAAAFAVAEQFEAILSDIWTSACSVTADSDKPLSAAMEEVVAAYCASGSATAIPMDGSTLESRLLMWYLSSWEVRDGLSDVLRL